MQLFSVFYILHIRLIFSVIEIDIDNNNNNLKLNNQILKISRDVEFYEKIKKDSIVNINFFKNLFFKFNLNYKNTLIYNTDSIYKTNFFLLYCNKLYSSFSSLLTELKNISKTNFFEVLKLSSNYDPKLLITIINEFLVEYNKNEIDSMCNIHYNNSDIIFENYIHKLHDSCSLLKVFYLELERLQNLLSNYNKEKYDLVFNKFYILKKINTIRNNSKNNTLKIKNQKLNCNIKDCDDFETSDYFSFNVIIDNYNLNNEINKLIISMNELEKIAKDIDDSNSDISDSNNLKFKKIDYKNAVINFLNCVEIFFETIKKNKFIKPSFKDYGISLTLNILKNILDTNNNYKEKVDYIFKKILTINFKKEDKDEIFEKYCNKSKISNDLAYYIQILDFCSSILNFKFPNNKLDISYYNETIFEDFNSKTKNFFELIVLFDNYFNAKNDQIKIKEENLICDKLTELLIKNYKFSYIKKFYEIQNIKSTNFKNISWKFIFNNLKRIINTKRKINANLQNIRKDEIIFIWITFDILKYINLNIFCEYEFILNYVRNTLDFKDSIRMNYKVIFDIQNYNYKLSHHAFDF